MNCQSRKLWLVCLAVGCGLSVDHLWAQQTYKSDPLDPAFVMPDASKYDKSKKDQKTELANLEKGVKAARSSSEEIADNILRGTADLNTAKAEFDRYFNGLSLPEMTQVDDDSLAQLGDNRDALLRQIRQTPNDSPLRKHLVEELVMPYFSRVAGDAGYHPAVRLNSVLIIGSLNRRDGQRNVEPSLPMESALKTLVAIASAPDSPAYLRIGALSGILRHAIIDGQLQPPVMDNALREQAIQLAVSILDANAPAPDSETTADEHYWMRRQGVQILGAFRSPGADGKAVASLRKILDDPETPLWLAADAVEAYGAVRFASAEQADVANSVKSIAAIVNRFLKSDIQAMDDYVASIRENRAIEKRSTETAATDDGAGAAEGLRGRGGPPQGKGAAGDITSDSGSGEGIDIIEIPNYKINDVRQRTKSIVYTARRALDGAAPKRKNEVKPPENLKALADAGTAKLIEQIVAALDKVMEETDLAPPKAVPAATQVATGEKPAKPPTSDERLRNSLSTAITSLEAAIGVAGPENRQPTTKSAVGG